MIKIENTEVVGWEAAIRGARNPMNSWHLSDSQWTDAYIEGTDVVADGDWRYVVGNKDIDLLNRLSSAGSDHGKFMRMITVYVDITAPLYWWKEFDTYKVGTVRNSCSTMHKIHTKEFTLDDFSTDHLSRRSLEAMSYTIGLLNMFRFEYNELKNKNDWWQIIQLLPSSYNQKSTLTLNYQVLKNMYHSRKNHKLDEWHEFCNWIEALPYSELITR